MTDPMTTGRFAS